MTSTVTSAAFRFHPVVRGALLGLSWGIAMRIWMRFISTSPEFTWSGTGYILGATTLAGMLLGLGWARRAKAKGNWWRLTGLSMLPLGVAAGGVMIPSVFLGALALGRKNWHKAVRGVLLGIAVGFQVFAFTAGPRRRVPTGQSHYGNGDLRGADLPGNPRLLDSVPALPTRRSRHRNTRATRASGGD